MDLDEVRIVGSMEPATLRHDDIPRHPEPSEGSVVATPVEQQILRHFAPQDDTLRVPSPSQREAIEAVAAPLLVLAGPGAGKTFCLIERIRYLIERLGLRPER